MYLKRLRICSVAMSFKCVAIFLTNHRIEQTQTQSIKANGLVKTGEGFTPISRLVANNPNKDAANV